MKKSSIVFIITLLLTITNVKAQDTIRIQTSGECTICKAAIEKQLNFEKGVKSASLDLKDKVVTVIYNAEKTNPSKLRNSIASIGYDADTIPANPKAYDKLKSCCKKDGH